MKEYVEFKLKGEYNFIHPEENVTMEQNPILHRLAASIKDKSSIEHSTYILSDASLFKKAGELDDLSDLDVIEFEVHNLDYTPTRRQYLDEYNISLNFSAKTEQYKCIGIYPDKTYILVNSNNKIIEFKLGDKIEAFLIDN